MNSKGVTPTVTESICNGVELLQTSIVFFFLCVLGQGILFFSYGWALKGGGESIFSCVCIKMGKKKCTQKNKTQDGYQWAVIRVAIGS